MIELKFDSEGVTYCPMRELATEKECSSCEYHKFNSQKWIDYCIYEDVFPEQEELNEALSRL